MRVATALSALALAAGLAAGPAAAGEEAATVTYEFVPGERFVKMWPPGWHEAESATGKAEKSYRTRWLPDGADADDPAEAMVLQIFSDERFAGRPPQEVLGDMIAAHDAACENLLGTPVQRFSAEGFPAARVILVCPRKAQAAEGEVRVTHLVHGAAAAYLLSRVWTHPPFAADAAPIAPAALREGEAELAIYSVCRAGRAGSLCGAAE